MTETQAIQQHSNQHLFAEIQTIAERYPDQIALTGAGGLGPRYTYGELVAHAIRLAGALRAEPYAAMREIGILSENRPEWCLVYLAIVAAGKTVVPIDALFKQSELSRLVAHSGLRAAFVSERLANIAVGLADPVRWIGLDSQLDDSLQSLTASSPAADIAALDLTNPLAVLIYTSGTTGAPKAVMLTHRNLVSNVRQARDSLRFSHDDVFLSVLPLHHTFEATCGFMAPLFSGASVVYARSLKSKEILEDIGANKVTIMCGVPLLYEKMYHAIRRGLETAPAGRQRAFRAFYAVARAAWKLGLKPGRKLFETLRQKAGLNSVRLFVSGGAAIPQEIAEFFNLIGFSFLQGYGMTECSPVISVNRPDNIRFGSVGPPLADVDVRIDNPQPDGIGEIIVHGPNTTEGYKNNPEATAALLKDGWLHTGDLGRMHKGHLWITGRAKNVIVSAAGKNIYPEEIEERLLAADTILEAVVFGRKKEGKQGEEVRAVIFPDMEMCATQYGVAVTPPDMAGLRKILEATVAEVNAGMSEYKRIAGFDLSVEELDKTSTKKVKRFRYQ
jgi:long-chain acyl-CoA synthetase